MFRDNKSMVNSSVTPNRKIHKHDIALPFHPVRESIASGIVTYQFIHGKHDLAHFLSKHWVHDDIWPTLKTILFWTGDTVEFFE